MQYAVLIGLFELGAVGMSRTVAHGQDRDAGAAVVGHGLRRDDDTDVGLACDRSVRLCGDYGGARARCPGDVDEEPTRGDGSSAGSDDEQIAGTDRRSRHVANHMDGAAHVEQPHRKALDGQPLATGTVQNDAARQLDLVDQGIGSIVGHAREDRANIGKGRRTEGPQGLLHRVLSIRGAAATDMRELNIWTAQKGARVITEQYFEDYEVGSARRSMGRTITEADIVIHAGQTGDFFPHHMDAEWCATQDFGRRIAHGTLIFSVGIGMTAGAINPRAMSYGYDRLRFIKPVFIGDTITVTATIKERRDHPKRATHGIVAEQIEITNQHGETVLVCEHLYLVERRVPQTTGAG